MTLAAAELCSRLQSGLPPILSSNLSNSSTTRATAGVDLLNRLTYAYISPVIIAIGVIGDLLTIFTLTHPLLRRASIIFTYLTLLALTDLLTHLSVVPMILWLLEIRLCSFPSALYYAHVGFPLANALMGASVWIVVLLTLSQYMAVCHPFHYGFLRSRRVCLWLFLFSYSANLFIYAPWATKKTVFEMPAGVAVCRWLVCERRVLPPWYKAYELIREALSRILPFLIIAFLNLRILITYRLTKRQRLGRVASTMQQRDVNEKQEQEERRLFALLIAIIIIFFLCTIPAAPLTWLVRDSWAKNLPFQIVRAVINLLEFTKFALNFYLYCLINPDIRRVCLTSLTCRKLNKPARVKGQPVNPLSRYTRSTRSTMREMAMEKASVRWNSRDAECGTRSSRSRLADPPLLLLDNDEKISIV